MLRKVEREPYHLENLQQARDYWSDVDRPVTLAGGKPVAVCADFHVPLFKVDYVNEALDYWIDAGAKTLVIAGDYWNMDSLSSFEYKQGSANLTREWKVGGYVITKLLESFDEILLTYGNHDARVVKSLQYRLTFAEGMRLMFGEVPEEARKKLVFTNLDHVLIDTPKGIYRACHPKDYSATPGVNARALAAKYHQHILCGHSHHSGIVPDVSGKYIAAEIGGFFDTDKTNYLKRTTKHANWTNGYGLVDAAGRFHLRSELWSTA